MALKKTIGDWLVSIWDRIGAPAVSVSADIAAVKTDSGNVVSRLGTPGAGTVAGDVESIETKVGTNTDAAGTTTLFARVRQIVDTYLADGTHGLAALETLIDNLEASQLGYAGTVTGVVAAPKFQCSGLVGHGDDYFKGFWAYVVWDAAGGGAFPQSQVLECTGYDSAGGDFTVAAFVPNVIAVGDKVLLIHPSLAYMMLLTPTRAGYLDELNFDLAGAIAAVATLVDSKVMGKTQIFEKSITSASNVGDVLVATITDQPCQIESVVIHADAAQTGDLTSCGIFGGAGKVVTFISAAEAVQANLNAEDKQVAWTGAARLAATKTMVISLVGSNGTAVDLTIVIKYRACVSGGYLV